MKRIVVIGAGHNGLVAANLLAEAGNQITVLESRALVGGACVTEELWPGYQVSSASYVNTLFLPQAVERFDLRRHGYKVIRQDPAFFVPYPDGRTLMLHGDERDIGEIGKFSPKDADTWEHFQAMLLRIGTVVRSLLLKPPPAIDSSKPGDLWSLLQSGLALRKLSSFDFQSFLTLATMGIGPVVDSWFESEELKAFLCSQAVIGAYGGVHQPGTAFLLLHDTLGGVGGATGVWGVVVGGMGAISKALAAAATERGAIIKTSSPVANIEIGDNGNAEGVRLQSGEVIRADVVVSGATPRRTFLELLPEDSLPSAFVEQMRRFKDLGASLKVHLALSELPDFTAVPGKQAGPQHRGLINFCPTVDFIENAWNDCRKGEFSQHPTIESCIHSVLDPSCAPEGKHIMTCFVQYGPRYLRSGNWSQLKDTVADRSSHLRCKNFGGPRIFHSQYHEDQFSGMYPEAPSVFPCTASGPGESTLNADSRQWIPYPQPVEPTRKPAVHQPQKRRLLFQHPYNSRVV